MSIYQVYKLQSLQRLTSADDVQFKFVIIVISALFTGSRTSVVGLQAFAQPRD